LVSFFATYQDDSDLITDNAIEDPQLSDPKLEAGTLGRAPKREAILARGSGVVFC